jgi:hypothetical protein
MRALEGSAPPRADASSYFGATRLTPKGSAISRDEAREKPRFERAFGGVSQTRVGRAERVAREATDEREHLSSRDHEAIIMNVARVTALFCTSSSRHRGRAHERRYECVLRQGLPSWYRWRVSEVRDLTGRCGTCGFFIRRRVDEANAWSGECRLGCWPSPLKDSSTCASHKALGTPWTKPGTKATSRRSPRTTVAESKTAIAPRLLPREIDIDMDQEQFRQVLREVLLDELGVGETELGERWQGGELVLVPGREGTQEKRIPIDSLFRKVVLIREKLRVLEQKINGHDKLSDEDRLQLQQYITQCYGSLTTFNVLFKNKTDHFSGQSGGGKDD